MDFEITTIGRMVAEIITHADGFSKWQPVAILDL